VSATPASAILLVPGSWHGAWAWEPVTARLDGADVALRAIDLPSNAGQAELADDARAVRAALDELAVPTLVVGHSYGGIAVSEGAAGAANLAGLVYLCAFMLDAGESLLDAMQHQLPDWISIDGESRSCIAVGTHEVLYNDCPPAFAEGAAARLSRQALAPLATAQTTAAWREAPSTYVVCDRDAAVPPAAQEAMAARAASVVHLDASHSPFLSRPDDVAALLLRALAG
jgi:pimeloyl-ACP methyl ester carboxylesterase